ncbi:MAG: hypothetical protein A2V70_20775 [Planctomycetes bacterium RBG_13_63_9]|nr:MAG: hypothetical protein A2V70_20775 [Planctomycetes bacterium RBG_13_63_9]
MEIELTGRDLSRPDLPLGYRFAAWEPELLDAFAQAKHLSFREEIDANVFPCLGDLAGCRRLMQQIAEKPGFLPTATWLLVYEPDGARRPDYCGTVQGIRGRNGVGSIQNLGIAPAHRGAGLGTSLLFQSLRGFRQAGIQRVNLEVTAQNDGAIRLYGRLGFRIVKTVFKTAEMVHS